MLDLPGRFRALVVPDLTVSQTRIPHLIEHIRITCLHESQRGPVGFHRRDQILVLSGNIQHLDLFQIHRRILGEILQPLYNNVIGK